MAGERTLPGGVQVKGFWTAGSDGWDTEMNSNMRKLGALTQLSALSRTTPLPTSPTDGQIFIVPPTDPTNPNAIAVRDNGAWTYLPPFAGLRAWLLDTQETALFDGTAWNGTGDSLYKTITAGSTLTLANSDSGAMILGPGFGTNPVVTLPATPIQGCKFRFIPQADGFTIISAVAGRYTGFGAHDVFVLSLPVLSAPENSYFDIIFDGTNWRDSGSSSLLSETISPLRSPQLHHGDVYFSYDGSANFQLLPKGTGGLIVNGQMNRVPVAGLKAPSSNTVSSALNYFYVEDTVFTITGAANNGSGAIRLTFSSLLTTLVNGSKVWITVHSVGGTLEANGVWQQGTVISQSGGTIDLVGSTFTNAYVSGGMARIMWLTGGSTLVHSTGSNGVEISSLDHTQTLVGMAWIGASNAVTDTAASRLVASYFNRRQKTCLNVYTADRTTTSTTFVEPNAEIEGSFVTWGDNDLPWSINGAMSSSSAIDGVAVTAGFDGTTAETEQVATTGSIATMPLCVRGSKSGLSEGKHFVTLLAKALSGGTATVKGTTLVTSLEVNVYQ